MVVRIIPGILSDHSIVWLTLCTQSKGKHGKGFYKFNSSLLKDIKYTELIRKGIKNTVEENTDLPDKGLLWDLVKCKVRGLSLSYSFKKRKDDRAHEEKLVKNIEEREKLIEQLNKTLAEIKVLKGIIPICASCKKVRTDQGFWQQVEVYIRDHSEANFSHGICPDCTEKLYPNI